MAMPMVDCRNLIEFCRAFERHSKDSYNFNPSSKSSGSKTQRFTTNDSLNPFSREFCRRSSSAALDLIILVIVLGSLGFLIAPYFKLFFFHILPTFHAFATDLIIDSPLPYFIGLFGVLFAVIVWEVMDARFRKCGNRHCQGLRRAVEYDIQLESEECVKYSPSSPPSNQYQLELGQDRNELEAELKKMAPPNGRTVLIFRAPCGCPAGRLEVCGPRKIRRIKK